MGAVTVADLLDEYGASLRGSWGDIDGRSEQRALGKLSEAFRVHANEPLDQSVIVTLREQLDVCPYGYEHWTEYCDDCEAGE